ncbi:endonuclease domain-containing protein [Caulobacter sp.]|uniref:endonuclease domain-containing protein n=2 Tax=Caulobacter sp. TaxID=78 RepID=UPI003BACD759
MKRPEKPPIARARSLRREMSLPEILLWSELRGGRLGGLKFRRQHPFGPYVLDFYCAEKRLAVEVDGEAHAHEDRPEQDRIRDQRLSENGVITLRIPARDVLQSVDSAIAVIREALWPWRPNPPPRGGGVGP